MFISRLSYFLIYEYSGFILFIFSGVCLFSFVFGARNN